MSQRADTVERFSIRERRGYGEAKQEVMVMVRTSYLVAGAYRGQGLHFIAQQHTHLQIHFTVRCNFREGVRGMAGVRVKEGVRGMVRSERDGRSESEGRSERDGKE